MADLCKMVEVGLNENGNLFYDLFKDAAAHDQKKAARGTPGLQNPGSGAAGMAFPLPLAQVSLKSMDVQSCESNRQSEAEPRRACGARRYCFSTSGGKAYRD